MSIATQARAVFLFLSSMLLIACGGGGGSDPESKVVQGQFVDSIVIGLRYSTSTMSGFTNDQGRFDYRAGEMVRFYVGDIFIGEAKGQAVITPVELVDGAVDENNDQVINIAIFLQSIDDDGNEANGIRITADASGEAAGQSVNFMLPASAFDADGSIQTLIGSMIARNGAAHAMATRDQARSALRGNLLGLLVGEFRGTFAGDDAGSWVATVDASGNITGTSTSNEYGSDAISGSLSSSGAATINGTVGTSVFSGSFSRNGRASGTWSDDDGARGTFTGSRVAETPPTGGGGTSGTLSISGNDSSAIGASFRPSIDPAIIDYGTGVIIVNWVQYIFSGSEMESRTAVFSFNENDGSVKNIGYMRLTGTGTGPDIVPTSAYAYSLDCGDNPALCSSITLDATQRQVTFNNTNLPSDNSGSDATGPIVVTGTLTW